MATKDPLQVKQEKAENLRQKIRDERAAREAQAVATSRSQQEARLDAELERLNAELEAEKLLTKIQKKGPQVVSSEATEAKRQAESNRQVAESVTQSSKEN